MPIVFGLGKNDAWNDPLNVYGGKAEITSAPGQNEASKFALSDVDKNDLINTLIAEAGGEGEQGMAAVASVIRNRAESRGKSPADIIREPKQFTGYEAPGEGARKAMQDPEMRSRAETILNSVLAGELPDPTGGADHYHADYVSPDWAGKMPQTAKIGQHIFYRDGSRGKNAATAYAPGLDASKARDPFDAVLRGDAAKPTSTPKQAEDDGSLLLSRLQPGKPQTYITDMAPEMRSGLTAMFSEAPDFVRSGLDILSGARTPEKQAQIIADNAGKYGFDRGAWLSDVKAMGPVEAGKKWRPTFRELGVTKNIGMPGGSKHQHGTATDLGWNGGAFSTAPKEVREWVHANASKYGLAFPMAHEPWHIETANARGGGAVIAEATGGQDGKQFASFGTGNVGKSIVVDGSFAASDPMGLMGEGPNPFAQLAAAEKADQERQQSQQAQGFEDQRIAALNDRHNREVEQAAASVPGGRFQAMTEQDAGTFQQDWKDKYQSQGRATDFSRNIGIGTVQLGQGIDNMMRVLIDKVPGGEWLNQKIDDIDRWMLDGQTIGEGMKDRVDFLSASRTERGQEAAAKTVFKPDSWELGGALSDPDWYLAQTAQSLPSMAVTMAPSGLLARGAYTTAIAAGATERAAAASAAKMATVAGGISEGIIGGAQTAQSIREKIATMPRDELLQSDAVKQLIADGKSEDEAIKAVSDDAQVQGLITAGVATGIFGGMGDRALAKIIGEGVSGNIAKRAAGGFVRGAVTEGALEEMPQNVAQTVAENAAIKRVDPDQQLFEGGAEAAASGLAVGGAMGGVMGGVGGAASPQRAEAATSATAPADGNAASPEPVPAASGPIGRSVQHAETQMASRQPAPPPEGAPEVGATVRVDAEGITIMGTVDSYDGNEAVVIDGGSGEVYQIPIANLTKLADAEWDGPAGRAAAPLPEFSTDPALEPAAPQASDTVTGPLPPASEQKAATERFPSAPTPGQRVIVDDERGGRFPATVRSYENGATEALVVTDDEKDLQVPVSSLAVSKLTEKQVEAQRLKIDPAVDRSEEIAGAGPNARRVNGRTMVFPDERHARLFQHSIDRQLAKRMGASQLDLAGTDATTMKQLAEDFGVTTQAVETMADDYRYRVLLAAKTANSDLPQRVAPVKERLLKRWQSERAKQDPAAQATEQTAARWWDVELTSLDRKRILDAAGVKRNEAAMWSKFTPAIKAKIEAQRAPMAEKPVDETAVEVDAAAHEAATSPRNDTPEPTQAQQDAGNYRKGHIRLGGLDISVENPAGSERKGVDPGGKAWSVKMKSHYGYIKGTVGRDKDHIDIFVRPGTEELNVYDTLYVVDQQNEAGGFDEHKVMAGFNSSEAARAAYLENYSTGWKGLRDITPLTLNAFKAWLANGDTSKPIRAYLRDAIQKEMADRMTPKEFVSAIATRKMESAAVVDPRGHLLVLKSTSNPDGDHAEFFGRLAEHDIITPERNGYIRISAYSGQIGASSAGGPSPAQRATLRAIQASAQREGVSFIADGEKSKEGSDDSVSAPVVRVGDERGASAPSAAQDRTDVERRQESNPPRPEKRNDATGPSERSGGEDVPAAARRADNDETLKPAFDASKYAWDYVWNSEGDAISDALSRLSSTNGGDQAIVDLIRSGATDAELLNFIGAQWGIGGTGGNRYMVETSAGPTVTVTLEKDDGKKRIVLKGPKLAKAVRDEFNVSLDEMKAKAEGAKEETKPEKKTKAPVVSDNTIFTADAAERARALLRSKLNRLNSGIDPEIMQAGIVLAGYHIERGARTFAAFASAMLSDLGEVARPYLKSWYSAIYFDPRAGAFDGMTPPDQVALFDLDAVRGEALDTSGNEPSTNSVSVMPSLFRDAAQRHAIVEQGFDSLDVAEQNSVLAQMVDKMENLEVRRVVIDAVPVDMMDMLIGRKNAAQAVLHDISMLESSLSVPRDAPVSMPVVRFVNAIAAMEQSGTGLAAKDVARRRDTLVAPHKNRPTLGAGEDGHNTGYLEDLTSQNSADKQRLARGNNESVRSNQEEGTAPDGLGTGDNQRSKDDASAVGDEGPFGPILRGYEGKWRDAAAELERRKNGDAVGALHHRDVGAIDLPWGNAGTNRHNGAGLAKLIAWHPEVLVDLQAFIDRLHVDRDASSARRIQLRDETGQAGIRLDYDGVAKTWLLTAFEAGKRRSEPSNLTLSEIWEGKFAGRDASPGTAPNEPSDAGWSRRTGKDNVPDPLQNVQSAAVPAQKRKDDPRVKTSNTLKSLPPPKIEAGADMFSSAKKAVLDDGLKTGHEYLVAIDDDGTIIEFGTASRPDETGLNDKLFAAMMNPARRIVIIHNHPRNSPVGATDVAALANPGMHAVWAVGHDGRDTRASLTQEARDVLVERPKTADEHMMAYGQLHQSMQDAQNALTDFIGGKLDKGRITMEVAKETILEATLIAARRAGVIDYFTNTDYDPTLVPGLERVLGKVVDQMRKDIFNGGHAGNGGNQGDGVYRPPKPVRHPGDMERLDGNGRTNAAIPGTFPLSEGSSSDGPGKDGFWARLEIENRPVIASPKNIVQAISDKWTDADPTILATVPLNYFPELADGKIPAIEEYLRVKRMMDAYRGDKHEEASTITDRWRKVIASNAYVTIDKGRSQQISDLMHFATLHGVDPSVTTVEEQAKAEWNRARQMYVKLPPKAREIFQDVRDAYMRQAEELDALLLENIRKGQQIALENAEKAYKAKLQDIKGQRLDPIARRRAEEDAASEYKADSTRDRWRMNARLTKLRRELEQSRVEPPYFPLARFGRYFVSVKEVIKKEGEKDEINVLHFSRHETEADRRKMEAEIRREYPGKEISTGVLQDKGRARAAMDPRMVAHIDEMLSNANVDESVRDALYQRYLETMPDLSMRKRQIHRKGTEGYNKDAFRVFASTMFHGAHQMARLKYSLDLQENLRRALEQAQDADDSTKTMTLYNEFAKRHEWVMNPTGRAAVNYVTSAAFVWYLGASPAAALVNLAQTWMMGVPLLGSRFGMAKASAALARASKEFLSSGAFNPATLKGEFKPKQLSADERSAMDAFHRSGLIDRTQSHDLAAVGETGTEYSPVRHQIMKFIGSWFHNVEVMNRSVTALAAYRLAREAGQGHLDAINTAHERTYATHFDMSNSSRPRIAQGDIGKTLLLFRSYNINMLYRLFRDTHQAVKGSTPEAKREARLQLAGTTGMMMLMAGITGTWGYGILMAIAAEVFGDDEEDFESGLKADIIEALGPELGGLLLNGVPGHLLGIDLTSRIGMPDLWFRSSSRDLQGKDEFEYWVSQILGAGAGLLAQIHTGYSLLKEGNVVRGVEAVVPKFIRDPLKAYRTANEGVTSLRGDEILSSDEISIVNAAAQFSGFTPAKVAETYDRNNALRNMESRVTEKRRKIMNTLAAAIEAGDERGMDTAMDQISAFNAKPLHRSVLITSDSIKASLKARAKNRARREDGVLIQNEELGRTLRDKLPETIYR